MEHFAHLTDIVEISHQCSVCGTTISEEQSAHNLCESCETKALAKFKTYLCNEFTDAERGYISECTDNVSLVNVGDVKDVKAVY